MDNLLVSEILSVLFLFIIIPIISYKYLIPLFKKYFNSSNNTGNFLKYLISYHNQMPNYTPSSDYIPSSNISTLPYKRFYNKKLSCMNSNESRMFYYINIALDNIISDPKKRSNIYVFPQVSLHAFINIQEQNLTTEELNTARKYLLNKNIDFLICKNYRKYYSIPNQTSSTYFYSEYHPVLMIEIDGSSHFSASRYGTKNFNQQRHSDSFKNYLAHNLDIPLLRYNLNQDSVHSSDCQNIEQLLRQYIE